MIMGLYQICGNELGRETRIICSLYKNKNYIQGQNYVNNKSLIKLHNSFILPYYIYCVEIWGNARTLFLILLLNFRKKLS